ncbi:hypothetical protein BDV93DRAFT_527262 [Ceratobasidium sp. AG-I]|nr:hypothetical protein BDV93DRAFT_527262 [Ceratobasidium sp. AG-I]
MNQTTSVFAMLTLVGDFVLLPFLASRLGIQSARELAERTSALIGLAVPQAPLGLERY